MSYNARRSSFFLAFFFIAMISLSEGELVASFITNDLKILCFNIGKTDEPTSNSFSEFHPWRNSHSSMRKVHHQKRYQSQPRIRTRISGISLNEIEHVERIISPIIEPSSSSVTSTILSFNDGDSTMLQPSTLLVTLIAIIIGVASQALINSMLKGDQGLGAFLSDGSGYQNSAFRPIRSSSEQKGKNDPLPWLQLPNLDFVEVTGQEKDNKMVDDYTDGLAERKLQERLEGLAERMRSEMSVGNIEEAKKTQIELERIMKEYGYEYKEGFQ